MKKLILVGLSLLIVSCGGGSGSSVSCDRDYWDGTIGTCLPSGWDILDSETLRQRGVPEETVVAFQSEESVSGQYPTVAITRERLAGEVETDVYSNANIRSVEVIDGYKHIDIKEVEIAQQKVKMHIFSAQPIEGEPRRRFYQVSLTKKNVGYTVTAVSPVSIDATFEKKMLLMVSQFTFEKKEEE